MPSLVGILLTALFAGKSALGELFRRLGHVRVPLVWYAVTLLLLPVLQFVAAGIATVLGFGTLAFAASGFTVINVVAVFCIAGVGEELGWRGFALPRLQARQQAFAASLLLGVLWALWHIPLRIAMRNSPLVFADDFLSLVAFAVLMTWIANNTQGSLLLMVLVHTMLDIPIVALNGLAAAILYLILIWGTVTLVVVRAGPARLSRTRAVAPAGVAPAPFGRSAPSAGGGGLRQADRRADTAP